MDAEDDLFRFYFGSIVDMIFEVFIKNQAALSKIEHVDHDYGITSPSQLRGIAHAVVVLPAKSGKHRVFSLCLDQLFLSPVVKASVVMQRHHRGHRKLGAFRNKEVTGNLDVGGGPKREPFKDVVASVDAIENARPWVDRFRSIRHQFEDLVPPLRFPRFEVLRAAVAKGQALAGPLLLALDEGIQAPEGRALPALCLVGRRAGLQRDQEIRRLHPFAAGCNGERSHPSQKLAASWRQPHGITPFSTGSRSLWERRPRRAFGHANAWSAMDSVFGSQYTFLPDQ